MLGAGDPKIYDACRSGSRTLLFSVADPGSGIGCLLTPGSGIWDPGSGMGESHHPDPGSGMNNPDYIFYFLKPFFAFLGVKILKFFDEDPGSGMETVRIRDPGWKKVGSGINIPDPPHCFSLA
jgi:hypothetical protein